MGSATTNALSPKVFFVLLLGANTNLHQLHAFILVNNTCEQGYTFITDSCYIINSRYRLLWEDAEWDCKRKEGYLAIIDTRKKFDQLVSLIESKTSAPLLNIGLLRDLSRWLWLDGTSLDSSLFATGYPTLTDQGETCIAAHGLHPVIVNVLCSGSYGYACESIEGKRNVFASVQQFFCDYYAPIRCMYPCGW